MSEVLIRDVIATDRSDWQALWAAYNAFYGREGSTALADGIVETAWHRLLDETEPMYGMVAEQDGSLIGLAHFVLHRNLLQVSDTCYMQDLFTTVSARGKGVAHLLVKGIEKWCLERGVVDMYWHTHASNETARGLYDRVATDTHFSVYRMKLNRGNVDPQS